MDKPGPSVRPAFRSRPAAAPVPARIGARPILWRGWLAGAGLSVVLWGAIAAVVAAVHG